MVFSEKNLEVKSVVDADRVSLILVCNYLNCVMEVALFDHVGVVLRVAGIPLVTVLGSLYVVCVELMKNVKRSQC